ncbi:hypothetical protein ACFQ9X_34005 [Catenulispora yoronensis]
MPDGSSTPASGSPVAGRAIEPVTVPLAVSTTVIEFGLSRGTKSVDPSGLSTSPPANPVTGIERMTAPVVLSNTLMALAASRYP